MTERAANAHNAAAPVTRVTLDTCADEPIHIPGSVQSHGLLLVFDGEQRLLAWSANAPVLLQRSLALAMPIAQLHLAPAVAALVDACVAGSADGASEPMTTGTTLGEQEVDCIVHAYLGRLLVEFERRSLSSDAVAAFAVKAHGAIARMKREKSVGAMLQVAAEQVRALTGFDRVMAYQFRPDDSGEVVAEARRDDLAPLLGMRYPASDIPAQARRLYIINTLRLIPDIDAAPHPMVGRDGDGPVDMSHCVLRSVSPIHLEYLRNMGVGASMSISIVVNDKLWGMLACHHMRPRQVPYSVRMATEVMVQVLAATVQLLDTRAQSALIEHSAQLRTRLQQAMLDDDDALQALASHAAPLCSMLDADAIIVCQYDRVIVHGAIGTVVAAAIVKSLAPHAEELVTRTGRDDWPEALRAQLDEWIGMLALCFDPATSGWMIAMRAEQIEAVRWAGKPEKTVSVGPLGARLTPRGSFEEWCQTVAGQARPWEQTQLIIAQQLLADMHRTSIARHIENERAREQLFAMLGHDLRDPLNSIQMAASVLELGGEPKTLGRRIQSSSTRMGRLVGQILDMSRITGGLGLGMRRVDVDLRAIVEDMVEEARVANPGAVYVLDAPAAQVVSGDADRLTQVIGNLLSNARNHGDAAHPIGIALGAADGQAVLEIRNVGGAIADDLALSLFDPFKRASLHNARNRGGMGLGLHIVREIVREHGGAIAYAYHAPYVTFSVTLPLA